MKKMINKLLIISLLGVGVWSTAGAEAAPVADTTVTQIKKNLKSNLPDLVIDQIVATPFAGVYEVDSGRKVFYVDATGNYALIGNLLDLTTKSSLTQARTESLNQIKWSQLPLNLAIKRTIGRGTNAIAIFTDPDCPFCQRLEVETLTKLTDVTIYYFLFPLAIHANAVDNSKKILCSENPESAMLAYMAKSQALGKNMTCNNSSKLAQMQQVGTNLVQVSGTPTIVLPNGRIVSGLLPPDYLNRLIATNQAESVPQ